MTKGPEQEKASPGKVLDMRVLFHMVPERCSPRTGASCLAWSKLNHIWFWLIQFLIKWRFGVGVELRNQEWGTGEQMPESWKPVRSTQMRFFFKINTSKTIWHTQPEWEKASLAHSFTASDHHAEEKLVKENAYANWSFFFLSPHLTSSLSTLSTLLSAC